MFFKVISYTEKCFVFLAMFYSSLGVHISFVRSIAMDSWTDQQLALMKTGGNDKCNQYLQAKGIGPRTPIKQKYESDVAQLYKQVLKARVEGKPEPTVLAKPPPKKPYQPANSMGSTSSGAGDPNGMERMMGETDQQYIARQTRLRDEAKSRMAAKFGNGGGMGGVGSSGGGSRMQGIGSDPSYNPNGGGMGDPVESLMTGFGSMMGAAGSLARTVASEQNVQAIKSTGASFWGSFASGVSTVANGLADGANTGGGGMDGLEALQREAASHKPSESKYNGFGSDQAFGGRSVSSGSIGASSTGSGPSGQMGMNGSAGTVSEAPGLPGEDRNGIERLTGESDAQYVARQTRLRDEARARMAAKFGNQGMGGVGATSQSAPSSGNGPSWANAPAPASANGPSWANAPAPQATRPAPNKFSSPARPAAAKPQSSSDFFASFGS